MVTPLDAAERRRRAKRMRLLVTDVDGVLTDAGVYYSARGEELKRFSLRDGMAVELLREAGVETAFLSRERSPAVIERAKKLELSHVFLGVRDKLAAFDSVLLETSLPLDAIAFIGDDVNDLALMRHVGAAGLTAAPADAVELVAAATQFQTSRAGGHGAFREFADAILRWKQEDDA